MVDSEEACSVATDLDSTHLTDNNEEENSEKSQITFSSIKSSKADHSKQSVLDEAASVRLVSDQTVTEKSEISFSSNSQQSYSKKSDSKISDSKKSDSKKSDSKKSDSKKSDSKKSDLKKSVLKIPGKRNSDSKRFETKKMDAKKMDLKKPISKKSVVIKSVSNSDSKKLSESKKPLRNTIDDSSFQVEDDEVSVTNKLLKDNIKSNSSGSSSEKTGSDKTLSDTTMDLVKSLTQNENKFESTGILDDNKDDLLDNNSTCLLDNVNTLGDTITFLSSSSTFTTDSDIDKSRNVTRELILKKQFLHDIQELKIELSQKNLLINTIKADHLNVVDELEDKLSDALHSRQLLQAKFEAHLRNVQNEHSNEMHRLKLELQESLSLQQEYQRKCGELHNLSGNLKTAFVELDLKEEEYFELKGKPIESLSPSERYNVKLYDSVHPLRVQIDSLEQRINLLTSDLRDREDELIEQKKLYDDESLKRNELDIRCQRFQVQVEELRSQLSRDTFRNQNYDNVQGQRDSLERKIADLEKSCAVYRTELESKSSEVETLRSQTSEQSQSHALLRQDKEYLSKQLNELVPRHNLLEERYLQVTKQLDDAKSSREELYEKYLNSREHYKQEYETRMKKEIEELTSKMNNELDRIRENTKSMYEMENRNLREEKNNALAEQERLNSSERETQLQYTQLLAEFRQLKVISDSKTSEVQNEVKLKSFELDRVQLLYEESLKGNKEFMMQNDLLTKKFDTLNKEYYSISASTDKRITELLAKNEELHSKLKIYEKLEGELDDVVMQAAEVTDEGDAERVLFAYGYGANIPSTAKRRMQQSVQLARRVLHLERANTSLRHDIERETKKSEQLAAELKKSTGLLNEAQQPYNYLIGSIQSRDQQNESMKNTIVTLEDDLKKLKEENKSLKVSHDQLSADLERLLNQREEMSVLKQVVLNMKTPKQVDERLKNVTRTATTVYGPSNQRTSLHDNDDSNMVKAKPVQFTKSETPSWYEKLKRQNQIKEYSK